MFLGLIYLHKEDKYRKYASLESHCTIASLEAPAVGLVLLQMEPEIACCITSVLAYVCMVGSC